MAPAAVEDKGLNHLRMVTQRLSSTPEWQLPYIISYLSALISGAGSRLCSTSLDDVKNRSDDAILLHKYKTQLSSLLQDRSSEARFAAAVLVKATIEAGGPQTLRESKRWLGSLISILGKGDSPATKKIVIIVVTRIFVLSHCDQQVVREVTTPALPGFTTACLKILASAEDVSLATNVCQALSELLPRHPASYRPFISQLRSTILPWLAPTPSDHSIKDPLALSEPLIHSAHRLFVLLTACAAKNKSGEEWTKLLNATVKDTHYTCDRVFRAFQEDWSHSKNLKTHARDHDPGDLHEQVQSPSKNMLGLPPWTGIEAGLQRLDGLVKLLQSFFISLTTATISLPLKSLMDVLGRICYVQTCFDNKNLAVAREERSMVQLCLSGPQTSAIDVFVLIMQRLGHNSAGMVLQMLDEVFSSRQVAWLDCHWRIAYARFLSHVLDLFGPSMPSHLSKLFSRELSAFSTIIIEAGKPPSVAHPEYDHVLATIRMAILRLPSSYLTLSTRRQMERAAVLSGDKEALLACTLNPYSNHDATRKTPALVPFLARQHQVAPEVEALTRPRMAPIRAATIATESWDEGEEEEDVVSNRFGEDDRTFDQTTTIHDLEERFREPDNDQGDSLPPSQIVAPPSIHPPVVSDFPQREVEIAHTMPTDNTIPTSPAKRPYTATPQGAYTLFTPNPSFTPPHNPDHLEDEPSDPTIPVMKKPRLEEPEQFPPHHQSKASPIVSAQTQPQPTPQQQQQPPPPPTAPNVGNSAITNSAAIQEDTIFSNMDIVHDGGEDGNDSDDSPIPTIYTSSDEEDDDGKDEDQDEEMDTSREL